VISAFLIFIYIFVIRSLCHTLSADDYYSTKPPDSHRKFSLQNLNRIFIVVPNELRNGIMDAVNKEHGIRTEAQAVVCSMKVEHFAPI